MPRTCYLCDKQINKEKIISLHGFPKHPFIRQKWLYACGLSETDDVTHTCICSRHFKREDIGSASKVCRVRLGAIPSINVPNPVPPAVNKENESLSTNHNILLLIPNLFCFGEGIEIKGVIANNVEELSNVKHIISSTSTNQELLIENTVKNDVTADLESDNNCIYVIEDDKELFTNEQSNLQAIPINFNNNAIEDEKIYIDNNLKAQSPVNKSVNVQYWTQESIFEDVNDTNLVDRQTVLEDTNMNSKSTTEIDPDEEFHTTKKRRFFGPRYISEIELYDVATPNDARSVINFIKRADLIKSKKIARLKEGNRRLMKCIAALKRKFWLMSGRNADDIDLHIERPKIEEY